MTLRIGVRPVTGYTIIWTIVLMTAIIILADVRTSNLMMFLCVGGLSD
jgi:hypothetical protein